MRQFKIQMEVDKELIFCKFLIQKFQFSPDGDIDIEDSETTFFNDLLGINIKPIIKSFEEKQIIKQALFGTGLENIIYNLNLDKLLNYIDEKSEYVKMIDEEQKNQNYECKNKGEKNKGRDETLS